MPILKALLLLACVPSSAPAMQPQPPQVQVLPDRSTEAAKFLDELERADAGLRRLVGEIKYQRTFDLVGDRQTRYGRIAYTAEPASEGAPPARKFAVLFDRFEIGSVVRNEEKAYIFDGQWLVERIPGEKLFKKHEVVPPGEKFDPLRLGQGPFPIPIGQRRADILERFTADLAPAESGLEPGDALSEADASAVRDFVSGTTQIRLVPREGVPEAEDFREVRLWYTRDASGRWLPRLARTINPSGDSTLVFLINVRTLHAGETPTAETSIPASMLDTTTPGEGWDVSIQRWAGKAEPFGGP